MGQDSNIEWTHHTFNPWMGCTKVSAGCANCYAENLMDTRYGKVQWGDNGTRVVKKDWSEPRKWNRLAAAAGERHRVFCASLADVFEDRPELYEPRGRLFSMVTRTPHLDWLFLTKRPQNIMAMLPDVWRYAIPSNVWLGTSIENQATADERIPHLLRVPAAVRFLSVEPLLGNLNLSRALNIEPSEACAGPGRSDGWMRGINGAGSNVDWVIVGGESGSKARPCNIEWIRSIVGQCKAAEVPCFVKQLGSVVEAHDEQGDEITRCKQCGHVSDIHNVDCMGADEGKVFCNRCGREQEAGYYLTDRKGGDMSEWPEDLRVRELPQGGAT